MADETKTDAQKAADAAHEADIKAVEARQKEAEAHKTEEQAEADKAAADADDARAEAEEAKAEEDQPSGVSTVADAKVAALLPSDMPAGDHMAQKFGNDPANPKHAPHLVETDATVRLTRITPDSTEPVTIDVHPEMVGDYLRAGWSR